MSRYLIIGDPHCRPDNLDKINKLFKMVESFKIPTIWMGDMLDTKDIVRAQCLNAYLNYFKSSNLKHIVLVGNHDYTSNECTEHSLEAFKQFGKVIVVDKPYREDDMLFVPYYRNPENFKQAIKSDAKYLFMHQDMIGMDWGNGHIATEGNDLADISSFKQVYSGHYHKFQQKNNLTFIGTPFSHNFGESNQDKYVGLFNSQDGGFCTLATSFPKHITINLDLTNPHYFDFNNTDHFRLIVKGTREQLDNFDSSAYKGFKIVPECISGVDKSDLKETQTPEELFSKWFNDVKKETDQELHTLGINILKESK